MSTLSTKDYCWLLEIRSDLYGNHYYRWVVGFREYSPMSIHQSSETDKKGVGLSFALNLTSTSTGVEGIDSRIGYVQLPQRSMIVEELMSDLDGYYTS